MVELSMSSSSIKKKLEDRLSIHDEFECHLCCNRFKQPRVLSCLHIFCSECLEQKLRNKDEEENIITDGQLVCPTCHQVTTLGYKGISDLPLDHVIMTMMEMLDVKTTLILCTSCKNHEKAVARCSDCINFLCDNCVQAHQNMRCFEDHKVCCNRLNIFIIECGFTFTFI